MKNGAQEVVVLQGHMFPKVSLDSCVSLQISINHRLHIFQTIGTDSQ